ncbi:MAG: 2-hydroxyacyl-CoA dehydratase [Dehalococcoidales bacterium]|nr:2-hydroxyacyl-CoA dehydratase [Dehalococcoidales bacterium]
MNTLSELAQITRTRPEKLKEEKKKGKKIVGYLGRFVPEELIYASGAIPYLLCKGGQPEPPDAVIPYMLRFMSPYSRSQIGYHLMGVDPVMPMLDLIVVQCSDCHESRLADLFEYFKLPALRLGVPADWEKTLSQDYYYEELVRLKGNLENITGNKVSDSGLSEAIASLNRIRDILSKINSLRKNRLPPLSGSDFIRLNHYSFHSDREAAFSRLNELYHELKEAQSPFHQESPRLLLAGHVVGMGDYVVPKIIEESGGIIAAEFLDEGMIHCRNQVKAEGDLLRNLARTYYLERTPPSIFQPAWETRANLLKEMIKEADIDGVIWYELSFEETYDMECSVMTKILGEAGIPILKLESSYEYSREAMAPLVTRIESFIETIKMGRS